MNFSIIYNPIATKFTKAALDHLIFKFVEKGLTLHKVAKSEYSGHVIQLIKELDPVSDYLITFGGDGTVNEAVRAFNEIEQHSIYAHISVGTTNDMANNFNLIRKDAIKSIDKLVEKGKEQLMDSLIVNGEPVSYVSAFGYIAAIPYLCNTKLKKAFGQAAYVFAAMPPLLRGPQRIKATYSANGITKDTDILLALVTTSKGMGGITLYDEVDLNDGKFEVCLIHDITPALIAKLFGEYLTDSIDLSKYLDYADVFTTDELHIKFTDKLPYDDVDNDGNKASFSLSPENNELHYTLGKKIRILMPEE